MAQFKYTETQRLRRWDLMALLAGLMLVGVVSLIQVLMNGQPNKNLLLIMSLGVLILSGMLYYLNNLRVIARYNEKNIKLSMSPVGTMNRKIKWKDVLKSEIIDSPRPSRLEQWNNILSSFTTPVTLRGNKCLHLRLKNNEVIDIGCNNPQELEKFVSHIREFNAEMDK